MRIGLLTNYLALSPETDSGIGLHYRVLADALAALGHDVHVIHPTNKAQAARAALAQVAPAWTCDLVPIPEVKTLDRLLVKSWPARVLLTELSASFAAARALCAAVRSRRLEIVETHATGTPALFYLGLPGRVPVVTRLSTSAAQLHANLAIHSSLQGGIVRLERLAVRGSDARLTHTRSHRDEMARSEGYEADSFALIPHGLPELKTPPTAEPEPDDAEEILYVGRFERRKGIDVLLEAIPAVLAARPRARLTLAGAMEGDPSWPAFAAHHPDLAGTRVRALGRVPEEKLQALYARCSVFVAPSRYESFGLIYVEAMRHARPVVGCLAGGIPDVVSDGLTGLLVPPGDARALADALLRLLASPPLRARLGEAGRGEFERRFSARRMAVDSAALYARVLNHQAGPNP